MRGSLVGGERDNARESNGGQRGREIGGVLLVWKMGERWSEVSPWVEEERLDGFGEERTE